MKRSIMCLLLVLACTRSTDDQKVHLVFSHLPDTEQIVRLNLFQDMTLSLEDPDKAPVGLRAAFPASFTAETERVTKIITGLPSPDGRYPITIEMDADKQVFTINGVLQEKTDTGGKYEGLKIHGTTDQGGNTELTAFEGKEVSPREKEILKAVLQQMRDPLNGAATEPVSVGESIEHNAPMSIPVPGVGNYEIKMGTTYTLKEINGDIAHFDVDYDFALTASSGEDPVRIEVSGDGSGRMIYHLKDQVALESEGSHQMQMIAPVGEARTVLKSKGNSSHTTEVVRAGSGRQIE